MKNTLSSTIYFLSFLAFPVLVFILLMYFLAMNTGLSGRRGGPQDAFRHTLAAATVARYTSPKIVRAWNQLFERDRTSPFDKMDRHNNLVGIKIGLDDKDLIEATHKKVSEGQIGAMDPNTVTWLPEDQWSDEF